MVKPGCPTLFRCLARSLCCIKGKTKPSNMGKSCVRGLPFITLFLDSNNNGRTAVANMAAKFKGTVPKYSRVPNYPAILDKVYSGISE